MAGGKQEGIKHTEGGPKKLPNTRRNTKIMAINPDSPLCNTETLEQRINDTNVHVVIAIESNITDSELEKVRLRNNSITNTTCWEDRDIKGGGGGGSLIFVNRSIPYL